MSKALLVIDVQMALAHDDAGGAARSCREAEKNIAALLAAFRERGETIIHIHHHALDAGDPFHADAPGAAVQPFAKPIDGEAIVIKHVSSGFVGTALEDDLRSSKIEQLILCGAVANFCVESTARSAGNLGFDAQYVSDAVWAYGATGPDGVEHTPEQLHSVTLSNIDGEFATVVQTAQVMEQLPAAPDV